MHGCALLHTCTPLVTLEQTLAAPKSARAGHVHKTGKNRASHASRTLRGTSSSVYASSPPPPPAPPSPGSGTSSGLVESPERARLSSYSVFCNAQQEQPVGTAHGEAGTQQRWPAARRRDAEPRGTLTHCLAAGSGQSLWTAYLELLQLVFEPIPLFPERSVAAQWGMVRRRSQVGGKAGKGVGKHQQRGHAGQWHGTNMAVSCQQAV